MYGEASTMRIFVRESYRFKVMFVADCTTTARQMSGGIVMMIIIVFDVIERTVYAG